MNTLSNDTSGPFWEGVLRPVTIPQSEGGATQGTTATGDSSRSVTLSVLAKDGGPLSKRVYVDSQGQPQIDSSSCAMSAGWAYSVTLEGLDQLPSFISDLKTTQALTLGIAGQGAVRIVTKTSVSNNPGSIARTKDYFAWPEKGTLLVFDYDPNPYGPKIRGPEHLMEVLTTVDPQFAEVEYVATTSTTAGLCLNNQCFKPGGGFHVYVRVKGRPERIEGYARNLFKKLWIARYGYIFISRAASLLERTIFDLAVFSPEHIVFEAGAFLGSERITQQRPDPRYVAQKGKALNIESLFLSPREEADYRKRVMEAKAGLKEVQHKKRARYRQEREKELVQHGVSQGEVRRMLDAFDGNTLLPQTPLLFDADGWMDRQGQPAAGPQTCFVGQVLLNPELYGGQTLADPLEPEYGGGKNKAILRVSDGQVTVYSQAHGGRLFYLKHDFKTLSERLRGMPDDRCAEDWAMLTARAELSDTDKSRLAALLREKVGITKSDFSRDLKIAEDLLQESGPDTHHEFAERFLADHIRAQYPDGAISVGGELYVVHGGIWHTVDPSPLVTVIGAEYEGDLCRRGTDYKAILQHALQLLDAGDDFFVDENVPIGLATPKGLHRLDERGEIVEEPLDPMRHRARFMAQAAPAPQPTPHLEHWLNTSIVGVDAELQRQLVQEIVGATLFGLLSRYRKAVLLYGATSTGKSMLQRLLQGLFPKSLQSTVKPSDWSDPQYAVNLAGSRLNIAGDLPSGRLLEGDVFKMVTGGDSFSGKHVYKRVQQHIRSNAAHVFSANTFPAVQADRVFFDRWLIVNFEKTIAEGDRIPDLELRILRDETAGLLWWAIEGAQRVIRQRRFTHTPSHSRLIAEWQRAANSVLSFLADEDAVLVTGKKEDFFGQARLYEVYSTWYRDSHRNAMGKQRALDEFRIHLQHGRDSGGNRGFRGVRLKSYV